MKKILCLCLISFFSAVSYADELIITKDYQIILSVDNNTENTDSQKINFDNMFAQEKYSYNESEDDVQSASIIKSKYDFNVKDSQMSVGIKGISVQIPF